MTSYVLLDDQKTGKTQFFTAPERIITAYKAAQLDAAFAAIEEAQSDGYYIAGYFAYELGYALEPALQSLLQPSTAPLLRVGLFRSLPTEAPADWLYTADKPDLTLTPKWSAEDYISRFEKVQKYIQAGDVYQINLTFPLTLETDWPAHKLYAAFRRAQPGRYGGIISLGGAEIISFSPELFFEKKGQEMRMRPMKGTRPRLDNPASDTALLQEMKAEPKSQAENLMIVDLLRNDLSRLSEAGSVKVPELFALETYPTVHQMTSEVTATLKPNLTWKDIFTGLFPCGSVTGAPKIRAMEIIAELETEPRQAYCGAIGFIAPNGDACFNVAIRTLQLDQGLGRYDVGSGVVLDSNARAEYEECLLKSDILKSPEPHIFETFQWNKIDGFIRWDAHKSRLLASAKRLGIKTSEKAIEACLTQSNLTETDTAKRVRLALRYDGKLSLTWSELVPLKTPLNICLSKYPLTKTVQTTSEKTSRRDFYDGERARLSLAHNSLAHNIDEVIFLDEDGYICEGSFTSVFIQEGDTLFTPALPGLLPGVLRAHLIASGEAKESHISLRRFLSADAIFVGNSLRGLMRAKPLFNESA